MQQKSKVEEQVTKLLHSKSMRKREINDVKRFKAKIHAERKGNILRYVKLYVGLVPQNSRKGTDYLLPAGSVVLIERLNDTLYRVYPDKGLTYDSIEQVRELCGKGNIRAKRHEFKYLNKQVIFTKPENLVLNEMLKTKYLNEGRELKGKLNRGQVYTNGNIHNAQGQLLIGKALVNVQ